MRRFSISPPLLRRRVRPQGLLLALALLLTLLPRLSQAQAPPTFCTPATDRGTLVFTTAFQNTPTLGNGTSYFWRINVVAGQTYSFSNCAGGSGDTYLRIYSPSGTVVALNDDNGPFCSGTAASLSWQVPAGQGGLYFLHFAQYTCGALSGNTTLAYRSTQATTTGPPTITGFTPGSGTAGTSVTLTGTNLNSLTGVRFNGTAATTFASIDGMTATATVPAGATTGPLTATSAQGAGSSAGSFTVLGNPTISSFSPTTGAPGTTVTITGTNLDAVTGVLIGGATAAPFAMVGGSGNTQLTAVVGSGAQTGVVTLAHGGGSVVSTTNFQVLLADLTRVEYFLDTDPGFGAATNVPITAAADLSNVVFAAPLGSLSAGFHQLGVRSQDNTGKWSLTNRRSFFYEPATASTLPNVVKAEYFIDADPGFGVATDIPVGTPAADVSGLAFAVNLSSLSAGFHQLGVRSQDANGKWSLTSRRAFFYEPATSSTLPDVTKVEYFIDTDPGFGAATDVPVTAAADVSGVAVAVPLGSLSPGFHRLNVRSRDANGKWSLTTVRAFFYEPVVAAAPNINKVEYYFDTDPGFGSATDVPVPTPAPDLANFGLAADASALPDGNHRLFIRTRDANGQWSLVSSRAFVKNGCASSPNFAAERPAASYTQGGSQGGSAAQAFTTNPTNPTTGNTFYGYNGSFLQADLGASQTLSEVRLRLRGSSTSNFTVLLQGAASPGGPFTTFDTYAATIGTTTVDVTRTLTTPTAMRVLRLVVQNPSGQYLLVAGAGTYYFNCAGPTITSFTPTGGPGGTSVDITGTNLTGATALTFNGVAAQSFTVNSATSMTAIAPNAGSTGQLCVTTPNGTACSSANYTYPPTIATGTVSPTAFCSSTFIQVPFTTNVGQYGAGNQFRFQLSDANGVFAANSRLYGVGSVNANGGVLSDTVAFRTPAGSGYRVRVVASNPAIVGTANSANLTVYPTPVATASSNSPVVFNGTIQLAAQPTGQSSYQWYVNYTSGGTAYVGAGQTLNLANAQPNRSGRYFVFISNNNGCQDSASVRVLVQPNAVPVLAMSQFGYSGCAGPSFNIGFSVTGNNFQAGNTITAQLSDASGSFAAPTTIGSVSFTGQGSGAVPALVPTNTPTGAGYRIRLVGDNPAVVSQTDNGSNLSITTQPTATPSSNSPVAYNGSIQLTAQSVAGAGYVWTGPGFSSNQQNPVINNVTQANSGTYTLYVTVNGCQSPGVTTQVTVNPSAQPILTTAQFGGTVCPGAVLNVGFSVTGNTFASGNTLTAQLSDASGSFAAPVNIGTVAFSGQGGGTVTATIPQNTPAGAGYRIRLTGDSPVVIGTDNGANLNVPVTLVATAGSNSPVASGGTLQLTAGPSGAASYQWFVNYTSGGTAFISNQQNPSFNNLTTASSGLYYVIVTQGGCQSTASTQVTVNPPTVTTLTMGTFSGQFCAGNSSSVGYAVGGAGLSNGTITAQLSDASGSFATPVSIGSVNLNGTGNGSIGISLPATTVDGGAYRIRLVSTNPSLTSNDNGANLTISNLTNVTASSNSPVASGATIQFTSSGIPAGASISWTGPSFATNQPNPSIPNAHSGNAGTYSLTVSINGCSVTRNVQLVVGQPIIALTTGAFSGSFCPGSVVSVPYSVTTGTVNNGNTFAAQLSDANGSFASPVTIGAVTTASANGSIAAQFPLNTPAGSGYRIRVVADSPAAVGSDNGSNLSVGAITYTWTGSAGNTDWFNAGNWSCGQVPNSTSVVLIPGGLSFYPVVTGGTASVYHLTVNTSASLTINSTFRLYGNVTVNGAVSGSAASSWYFFGGGNQYLYGSQPLQVGNVYINPGVTFYQQNVLNVYSSWYNDGVFVGNPLYNVVFNGTGTSQCVCGSVGTSFYNFVVNPLASVSLGIDTRFVGNLVNNGSFNSASWAVVFDGTTAQTLGGTGNTIFHNITINNTVGVTLVDNITVLGHWINNGLFVGGTYSVIFAGTSAQLIGGSVVTNFYNVTFNNLISVTLNQHIYVLGSFTNTGVFYGYHVVGGVTSGYFVRFGGTVAQVINANATTYFYHFYVDNVAGVSLSTNIYIAGNYYLYAGSFSPGTFTCFFNGTEGLVQTVGGYTALTFHGWNIVSGARVRLLQHVTWLGGFFNAGTFYGYNLVGGVYTGYTCVFGGNAAQVIGGGGVTEFWHVTWNNLAGITLNQNISVWGQWLNNGGYFANGFLVNFCGNVAQLIGGAVNTTFHHITISNLVSVTLNQPIVVIGNWAGAGVFLGNGYLVYFNGTVAQTIFTGIATRFFDVRFNNNVSVSLLSDIYLAGNWTNDGGFLANGYRVFFTGSGATQVIAGAVLTQFHHLTILNGAQVQLGRVITVLGDWTNHGAFLPNSFTVTFAGTVAQLIGGTASTIFHNIVFTNPVSVTLAQDIRVRGGWLNNGATNGSFLPATYNVYFDGNSAQAIAGSATSTFFGLHILNTVGVSLTAPIFIKGDLVNNGLFSCVGYLVTFNGTGLQTIGGTSTTIFGNITCDNAVGVGLGQHIRVRGDFRNLALFTAGGYIVYFDGSVAQGIYSPSGTLTFHHIVFANLTGVTLHHDVFLTGDWTNHGGFLPNGKLVTFKGTGGTQFIDGSVAAVFHHFAIATGAVVQQNLSLTLLGDWTNHGTFLHHNLLVSFNGTVLQTIGGSALSVFYDVTFNNAVNVSLGHDIDVLRHFVNHGSYCGCGFRTRFNGTEPQTIICTSGRTTFHDLTFANAVGVTLLDNIGVSGNWVNNGGFVANGFLVLFNGTGLQTIGGSVLTAFHHWQITNNGADGVSLLRDVSVTGNFLNNGRYCGCGFLTLFNGSTAQGLTCSTGQTNFHHLTLANTSADGVTLTGNINVTGNWLVSGFWAPQTHTVFFTGISGQTIGIGGTVTQALFHGISIDNPSVAGVTLGCPLFIRGNWANNGVFGCGNHTVFAGGTTGQTFGGTSPTRFWNWTILNPAGVSCTGTGGTATAPALGIERVLTMATGSGNLACDGKLTLLSNATGTAMVVNQPNGGVCTGVATMQRFITGLGSVGYRHYSSPMQRSAAGISTTVQEFADDLPVFELNPAYNTVGNSVTPFPTLYKYDEARLTTARPTFNDGFMVPGAAEDLEPLRGYTAQTNPTTTVDISGLLQTGNVSYSLSRGSLTNSGWHLLGNPYPAPMDWDIVRTTSGMLTGVAEGLYVFQPSGRYTGTYKAYVNGVGQNGGSKDLAAMQGFVVRATSATAAVNFTNAVRATSYVSPVFERPATGPATTGPARPTLRLVASNTATTAADETVIYFEPSAGLGFSTRHDAYKVQLNGNGRPSLWSQAGTESLAINGLPDLTTAPVIPLGVRVSVNGAHRLVLTGLTGAPAGTQVWLEDRVLNHRQNLAVDSAYAFTMLANYTGQRFYLNFVAASPLAVTTGHLDARTALYPNPTTGQATLELAGLREQGPVTVEVVNVLGQTVRRLSARPKQGFLTQLLDLRPLPTGIYTVRIHAQEGTVVKRLVRE